MAEEKQRKQYPSTLICTARINCKTLRHMEPGMAYAFPWQTKDRLATLAESIGAKGGWKSIAESLDLNTKEGRKRLREIEKSGRRTHQPESPQVEAASSRRVRRPSSQDTR